MSKKPTKRMRAEYLAAVKNLYAPGDKGMSTNNETLTPMLKELSEWLEADRNLDHSLKLSKEALMLFALLARELLPQWRDMRNNGCEPAIDEDTDEVSEAVMDRAFDFTFEIGVVVRSVMMFLEGVEDSGQGQPRH